MRYISQLILMPALLCIIFIQSSEFVIRPAQRKDLSLLAALSKKVINEHFRKIIIAGYPESPVVQNPILLDTYLTNMITGFESIFEEKQLEDNRQRIFVAIQEENKPTVVGLCFSQQISDDQAYIRYIIVDENNRHGGVGSALLTETLKSYNNITSCELRTFSHANEKVQSFYEKHGFVSDKIPAPLQRKFSEYSDTITFVLYHLDIKK